MSSVRWEGLGVEMFREFLDANLRQANEQERDGT